MKKAVALVVLLASCAPHQQDVRRSEYPPRRIVSMNPCVDAVLQEIAGLDQIAAISHYSRDPRATSVSRDWAWRYPAVGGNAEDVIAARPDLVIAGPHVAVQTVAALKRLGIPLMQVTVPESIPENKAQISAIAARIGRQSAGTELNQQIDAAVKAATWPGEPLPALIWQGSGLVPGKGTLADTLLGIAGFRNISPDIGLKQWDILPLEGLLFHPPKVLMSGEANMGAGNADANRMLGHPVLQEVSHKIRVADYPSNLLHCGGPVIIRAVARLAEIRREEERKP